MSISLILNLDFGSCDNLMGLCKPSHLSGIIIQVSSASKFCMPVINGTTHDA